MSSPLSKILNEIRHEREFKSTRAFYLYLQQDRELPFNYSYYARIEAGKSLPSSGVISFLGQILGDSDSDRLVIAYCATLFPQKESLFEQLFDHKVIEAVEKVETTEAPIHDQSVLNTRQLETICSSKTHYYLFLVLTLARQPLEQSSLKGIFKSSSSLERALLELKDSKVIRSSGSFWSASIPDAKFPPTSDSERLKSLYKQLDEWDLHFDQEFKFESLISKSMIRRISGRYLTLLMSHCNLLFDAVRSSEEVTKIHNSEVLSLQLKLTRGRLPG